MGADLYIVNEARNLHYPVKNRMWMFGRRAARLNTAAARERRSSTPDWAKIERLEAEASVCIAQVMRLVGFLDKNPAYYFRDTYNGLSVLSSLGLSWSADVFPLLDRGNRLNGKKLTKFRAMISETQIQHEDVVTVREELLQFLDRAICQGSAIECSI